MNIRIIVLRERSQTKKSTHCISFIYNSRKWKGIYSGRKQISSCLWLHDHHSTDSSNNWHHPWTLLLPPTPCPTDLVAMSHRFYLFKVVHNHSFHSILMAPFLGQSFKYLICTLFIVASDWSPYLCFLPVLIYPPYCGQSNY